MNRIPRPFVLAALIGWMWLTAGGVAAQIGISAVRSLNFGSVVPAVAGGGSVSVNPDGSRSCSPGATCLASHPGAPAEFDVSGDPFTSYTISLPAAASLVDGSGNAMSVDSFVASDGVDHTLDVLGSDRFTVGATLSLSAGQPSGNYSGSFEVVVEYQ